MQVISNMFQPPPTLTPTLSREREREREKNLTDLTEEPRP